MTMVMVIMLSVTLFAGGALGYVIGNTRAYRAATDVCVKYMHQSYETGTQDAMGK